MKILSVDDKVENLYLLESMLNGASCGYEVVSAHHGVEAMQKLDQEKFDLIISDILMPQMDGFELCRQVKQQEALRDIPFVFYTATYTEKEDEELGLRLGASRFIIKPLEPEKFLGMIREVIQQYEAGRLPPVSSTGDTEEIMRKAYNRRLVRKLDQKVQQLELLTQKLQRILAEKEDEVVRRRKAEEEVSKLNTKLEERVRQRTAELAAVNNALETFVSAVSHDLRAPLRALSCYSDLLAEGWRDKLDEEARTCLAGLQSGTQRMSGLIEALLQLSSSSGAELRRRKVNLSEMASEIERDLRREQPNRQVDFNIAPDLATQGDPALLRSVLGNLLGNAWKFTSNSPHPRIEFGCRDQDGKPTYFVSDNGVGFSMESAENLFLPFKRLHDPTQFPGTGIGLAIVRQIVRRHGGDVRVESAPGKGATFYFTLQ
jgi:signal transduction histidine kinase